MALEIILTSDGSQQFTTVLDGVDYTFNVSFNTRIGVWRMYISNTEGVLVNGVVLVAGANVLNQYVFDLDNIFVLDIENFKRDANSSNLGTVVKMFKLTSDEVLASG